MKEDIDYVEKSIAKSWNNLEQVKALRQKDSFDNLLICKQLGLEQLLSWQICCLRLLQEGEISDKVRDIIKEFEEEV